MSLAGYAPEGLNAIVGIGAIGGNFAALPGMYVLPTVRPSV